MANIDLSIIVPTINEADNLPELVRRIDAAVRGDPATAGGEYEIIIVDDNSQDRTVAVCGELSRKYPVKLMVRERPKDGLSGAVLHGMAATAGKYLCVMDADLQHPPEKIPDLLAPLRRLGGFCDWVAGYVAGGTTSDRWTWFRQLNSQVATLLARPFAGKISDPMSGFFALRRESYLAAKRLTPLGYKIALELMCKCQVKSVAEIPIHFGSRLKGESKLSLKQQFRYLEHLSRLYDFKFPRASPVVKFLIATAASWLVAAVVYLAFREGGAGSVAAPVLAYPFALAVTALFHFRYVRTQREFIIRPRPWRDFAVIAMAEWIVCALTALWVSRRVDRPTWTETFVLCFGAATVMRYILRKEFLLDIRGLRKEIPREVEAAVTSPGSSTQASDY